MYKFITFVILLIGFYSINNLQANSNNNISAIINSNYVIFNYDVNTKQKFLSFINNNVTKEQALEIIINNYLLLETNKNFGITISKSEFDSILNTYLASKNISLQQFFNNANKIGISNTSLLAQLNEEYLVDKIKQVLTYNLSKISEIEVNTELERMLSFNNQVEFDIKQISILNTNDAQQIINKIYNALLNGESFDKLAQQYSQDLYAKQGGNVGFVASISLPTEATEQIKALHKYKFTKPILINDTYKIYYLIQSRPLLQLNPQDPTHISQLRDYAKQKVAFEKGQVLLEDFLQNLITNTSIVYY